MVGDNPSLQAFMKTGSDGYPPDLDTLVTGLDTGELKQRKIKFLRRIPIDPMTGQADWVVRSNTQDRNVDFWDRMHVFDVRSRSRGTALDGPSMRNGDHRRMHDDRRVVTSARIARTAGTSRASRSSS
jgi:hypothetical protein